MFLTANDLTFTEQITPYLPILGTIVGAAVVGGFALWNRRRGATENRAPDVTDMWTETEKARSRWRIFEDLFYNVRGHFRAYVLRVQAGGSTELTPAEQAAHDNDPTFPKEKS